MTTHRMLSHGKSFLTAAAVIAAIAVPLGVTATSPAHAFVCGRGFYRAGCVGPNGAVVARRPGYGYGYGYGRGYRGPVVTCARGPYRAGCAGPNGAVYRRY